MSSIGKSCPGTTVSEERDEVVEGGEGAGGGEIGTGKRKGVGEEGGRGIKWSGGFRHGVRWEFVN